MKKQNGITLIALVISIIVMLILAGVSINAVIGDNGIITKAQNSNYVMSKAVLEEWIQQIYVENYDEFSEFDTKIEALTTSNKYKQYFYNPSTDSGIGAVNYVVDNDGHALYLIKKSALPDDIKNQITGGEAGEETYRDYLSLNDVYGVTSDLRVYYCSKGTDSIYGLTKDELDIDNPARKVTISSSLANAIGTDTTVTAESLRSVKQLTIDSTMTSLNELYNLTSLKELTLNGVTLDNLSGIENCLQLNYVYFKSSVVKDYSALSTLGAKLNYLYLYNIDDNELETLCNGIKDAEFNNLNYFAVTGNYTFISDVDPRWIAEGKSSKTITNLTPLSTLSNVTKKAVRYFSINNNNITGDLSSISGFEGVTVLRCEYNSLTSLNGLENMDELRYLYASANLLGATADTTTNQIVPENNTSGTAIASLENNLALFSVNLRHNPYLSNVDYLKNDTNIRYLLLEGCNKLMNVNNITNIILGCGTNYGLPCKFLNGNKYIVSDYYVSTNVTYEELYSDLYNNQYLSYINLNYTTKITNEQLNELLLSIPNLKSVFLVGTNITSLDFIKWDEDGFNKTIRTIDLRQTAITDISKFEKCLNLTSFGIDNENIDLTTIQKTISRASYSNEEIEYGMVMHNVNLWKQLSKCTDITKIEARGYGGTSTWVEIDLSNCEQLTSVLIGVSRIELKLPSICKIIRVRTGASVNLSNLTNITYIGFHATGYAGVSSDEVWTRMWNNIPKNLVIKEFGCDYLCDVYFNTDLSDKNLTINHFYAYDMDIGNSCYTYIDTVTSLKSLYFENKVGKLKIPLEKISNLKLLESLVIYSYYDITSLDFIKNNLKLKKVVLYDCSITALRDIENLKELEYLNLQKNSIYDISTYKDEDGNAVTYKNLQILADLYNNGALRSLYLSGNAGITDYSLISGLSWDEKDF